MRISIEPERLPIAIVTVVTAALVVVVTLNGSGMVLRAWLAAGLLLSAVPIGAIGLLLMMRLIPGAWEPELRPMLEIASLLQPVAWLILLPVLLNLPVLWRENAGNPFRHVYLTPVFLCGRTIAWFAMLTLIAWLMIPARRVATPIGVIGMMIFVILGSLIAIDWVMALEPTFHSATFPLYVLTIQFNIALDVAILGKVALGHHVHRPKLLGALLLTSLLLWAYLDFMQFFILWSGNLPKGITWYLRRAGGIELAALWCIFALHAIPIGGLLLTPLRGDTRAICMLGALTLAGKAIECGWLVLPSGGATNLVDWALFFAILLILSALFAIVFLWASRFRIGMSVPRAARVTP